MEGTLLLPSLVNIHASPIDACKIQGGCSGCLRQEFRELKMLNDITHWMYDSTLPATVLGETWYSLIHFFQDYIGFDYTPHNMDSKLMWSMVDPFDMVDATDLKWDKTLIAHRPISQTPEAPLMDAHGTSISMSNTIVGTSTMLCPNT